VDEAEMRAWYDEYLRAFTACGRGDSDDLRALLRYYGVPLLFTTDAVAHVLTTEEAVLDAAHRQIERLRTANYDRSEMLGSRTEALNATSVIHHAEFSRRRADGSEIEHLRATYLIMAGPAGRRMFALAVHTG
jgi:hypothetical protein